MFRFTLLRFLLRLMDEVSLLTGAPHITFVPETESTLQDLEFRLEKLRRELLVTSPIAQELEMAMTSVFYFLCARKHLIPDKIGVRIKKDGVHRVVCDYLVGLSDQQLLSQRKLWFPKAPAEEMSQLKLL